MKKILIIMILLILVLICIGLYMKNGENTEIISNQNIAEFVENNIESIENTVTEENNIYFSEMLEQEDNDIKTDEQNSKDNKIIITSNTEIEQKKEENKQEDKKQQNTVSNQENIIKNTTDTTTKKDNTTDKENTTKNNNSSSDTNQENTNTNVNIPQCTETKHGIEVGNSNKWFNTKEEAIALYDAEIKKWGNLWTSFQIENEEYYANCPYGYEIWSCLFCGKWTINFYYN